MAKPDEEYVEVDVESYRPDITSGLHGKVHVRPLPGQRISTLLHVECSKKLTLDHPVGTQFRLRAKLTDREDGGEYLYSYWGWKPKVLWRPDH